MSPTILVVEDEAIIADDIQRILVDLGYEVPVVVASGEDALAEANRRPFALALMDIRLQGTLDGIDTAARLRSENGVPVVYLSSHSDEATLARAKETAPYGYLLKPFTERDLRIGVEVALRKHELEKLVEEQQRWFSTTLRSIGDAVIATDREGVVTFMNTEAERITGWSAALARSHKLDEVLQLLDPRGGRVRNPVELALERSESVELPANTRLQPRVGARVMIDDSASPIVDEHGAVLGGVVVFRDVTERRKLERRLFHAEKLASLGTLAGGMGHEINNPLSAVVSNVDFARELGEALDKELAELGMQTRLAPTVAKMRARVTEIREALRDAAEGAERVKRIVGSLRRFTRAGDRPPRLLELPDVLDGALTTLAREIPPDTRIVKEYGITPYVEAEESLLMQLFVNLLQNAVQAVAGREPGQRNIHLRTSTDGVGRAVIEVKDDGAGISPDVLPRIFDPFFTTRPIGSGMGLGLAIAQTIVASIDGELGVQSELGVGSTFEVLLPPAAAVMRPGKTTEP